MSSVWRGYLRLLQKYPFATMSTTTGTLMAAGDAISQVTIEKKGKDYDAMRTGRFLVFGLFIFGPILRLWYVRLDKMYTGTKFAPLKMMLTDQVCFAPCILMLFLTGMGVMRGESVSEIKQKVKRDYYSVLLTNYTIWPAAQGINFMFVPLQHRVLFVNGVALGWNTYLAWKSEQK